MKNRFLIAVLVILLLQVGFMVVIWGSPSLKLERSFTPTPSATRIPPPATPMPPTPIPTLIPVGLGAPTAAVSQANFGVGQCSTTALDLLGTWVKGGKPEKDLFNFKSSDGKDCLGSFEKDVLPLFNQPNIWYTGALACTACHGKDLTLAAANLSLVDYNAIRSGSRRGPGINQGQDILGDAQTWEQARLYQMLFTRQMPIGRPYNAPEKGPVVRVGIVK